MKKRIITISTILFMCVALISVGFAAWVITGNASAEGSGSIQTDTVTNKSFEISELTSENNKIVFGAPAEMNKPNAWLTSDSKVEDREHLTVTFTATVKKGGELVDFSSDKTLDNILAVEGTKVTVELGELNEQYQTAQTSNLVTAPTVTITGDAKGQITITVSVNWGTAFEGKNPYEYYNAKDYNPTLANEATEKLTALNLLNKVTYSLTVNVTE